MIFKTLKLYYKLPIKYPTALVLIHGTEKQDFSLDNYRLLVNMVSATENKVVKDSIRYSFDCSRNIEIGDSLNRQKYVR